MYVSGSLKQKVANFYREQIFDYGYESFDTPLFTIEYNGEIIAPPWEEQQLKLLERKQEEYIRAGTFHTRELIKKMNCTPYITSELNRIINKIFRTPRNITFILYETFYKGLYQCFIDNNLNIKKFIEDFDQLLNYFDALTILSQRENEIICSLFLDHKDYKTDLDIIKRKESGIHFLHPYDENLHNLGEFIDPKRLKKLSAYFNRTLGNDYSAVCVALLLKDEILAEKYLKEHFLNPEKEPKIDGIPENLLVLSKKHEPLF